MNRFYSLTPFLVFALFVGLRAASLWVPEDHEPADDSVEERQLHERELRLQTRLQVKIEALRQLSDGECTLSQAVARVICLMEPEYQSLLQHAFPAQTAEQSLALQMIELVRARPIDPEQKDDLQIRLQREFEEMKESATAEVGSTGGPHRVFNPT